MNTPTPPTVHTPRHITSDQYLERSRWYGPNLLTLLSTTEETGGAFSLVRCVLRKGFEPPLHIHSREEESYLILEGEIIYEAGEQAIHARPGDYVHLPRHIPHTFRLLSDTATLLLLITPAGFEQMFIECSTAALSLELPPRAQRPAGKEFFEKMERINTDLGVTMLPSL